MLFDLNSSILTAGTICETIPFERLQLPLSTILKI